MFGRKCRCPECFQIHRLKKGESYPKMRFGKKKEVIKTCDRCIKTQKEEEEERLAKFRKRNQRPPS